MSQFDRDMNVLNNRRIVYIREPITDTPSEIYDWGSYYEEGTFEYYALFKSKAKINTYKSLKWHLLVLWYLNPQLDQEEFVDIADVISTKSHGFTTFEIHPEMVRRMVYEISMLDLDDPPKNKLRKVIFKMQTPLTVEEKLKIVGSIIGRSKRIHEDDIYQCMLDLNDLGKRITLSSIANLLACSVRTIQRNMGDELKREKELLNRQL